MRNLKLSLCGMLVVGFSCALGATASAQGASTQTGSLNADIGRAIQEITGRAPRPEESDPARYGFSYAETKSRVAQVYLPCDDPQISQAILAVTGRPARGLENQGECHPALYGKGQWNNYADLQAKVRQTLVTTPFQIGVCRLPDVTRAITEVKTQRGLANTRPSGAGELGECNSHLYGDAVWSSYADLKSKVDARLTLLQTSGLRLNADNTVTPIASRGKSEKWLAVAGAVFTTMAQWKADKAAQKQAAKQQAVQSVAPQPMPAAPAMPAMQPSAPPAPMGGLQPNMLTPEMMQQLMQMLQAQQQQQQTMAPPPMAAPASPAPSAPAEAPPLQILPTE